ncbi:MAG: DNA polymerase III subunit epsilon [Tatlockia sp.]|jgi:DNA polymerase-3 subunit epsilon
MRQIVLDTETTGIGHETGHRIIEIGCIELVNRRITNNRFHTYLNPERSVDEGAFRVHGLGTEFLQDKPLFKDVAQAFLAFIDGAELIIHNAAFDVGFLNAELKRIQYKKFIHDLCSVCDTLVLAREKHPGQRNNLDALCKRYDIDNTSRVLHGALLDAEILAKVYLAMSGGQANLFEEQAETGSQALPAVQRSPELLKSTTPVIAATAEEIAEHEAFLEFLVKKSATNLWTVE